MEVVGKLVSLLGARDKVVMRSSRDAMSGLEYRAKALRALCSARWTPENVVAFCVLLGDIGLTHAEWDEVADIALRKLFKVGADEVPPIVYQLLQVTKPLTGSKLLGALINYYGKHLDAGALAEEERRQNASSQMDSADVIDSAESGSNGDSNTADLDAMKRSLGMVLYHVSQALNKGHPIQRDVMKLLRSAVQSPDLVLHTFVLFLALAMTGHKKFRQPVGDTVRSAVVKQVELDIRSQSDAWFRRAFPAHEVQRLIRNVITMATSFGGWELIAQGVLDLAKGLLDTNPPGFKKTGTRTIYLHCGTIMN